MLTYGFYNSVNKDRRYDAEQIGAMFDGLITDGIFANYKSALNVTPGQGFRELVINPGKAWFNGTWTTVDDGCHHIHLLGSAVETTYFIYLTVNKADRVNTIAGYTYERLSDPGKNIYSYLLAQVTIPGGEDQIQQSMIVDTRGSDLCPYVTGILETVSFEEIVREVCGDNWQMWLDEYSEALNLAVSEASETANTALAVARKTASDVTESNNRMYTWAQYSTIPTGAASYSFESASDEMTRDAPPMRKLFWAPTFDGNTLTLVNPLQKTAVSAKVQLENWKRYKYFYGDGLDGTTDNTVYRYDELSVVYDGSTSNPVGIYTIKTSKAVVDPAPVVAGDFIGFVVADSPSAYPKNGPSGEYWYVRFSARADDVFFDDSETSLSAQTVQEALEALSKAGGPGTVVEKFSGDAFEGYDKFYDSVARMRVNPYEPLNIETYDGSGQLTHPGVRYFPDGWCGHKYWMVATPYPNSAIELENPCVWYSDDGYTWSAEGIPNPLDLPLMVDGVQASMNSDPHLLLRPDGVMEVWWRTNYWENSGEGLYTVVYRRTSTDGTNWTDKEELYRALTGGSDGIVCPVVMHEDGVYKIWAVSDQESLRYYESTTGTDWKRIRDIDVSNPDYPEYKVWHFDVNHTAKGYEFVGNYGIPGDHTSYKYLYYAVSQDNVTYSGRVMILSRGPSGNFDERLLYRPTIVRLDNKVMVYYGANNASNEWHVGQIEAPSAYLFNAVLIGGERLKAIESKNAQQDGRIGALEAGGVKAAEGQTIVQSFDVSPWLEGYWKPESNGELTLYGNFHRSQLIRLESLMNGGDFPAITAICSSRPYPVLRVNYFDGNLRWIGFDSGRADPANQGAQEPTPINWPAGAVYFALSANTVDKTTISFSSDA